MNKKTAKSSGVGTHTVKKPQVSKTEEKKKESRGKAIIKLIIGLVLVVGGSVLFVGAVSGWFGGNTRVVLDDEYIVEGAEFININADEYNKLIEDKKSFIVFVDQDECKTADRVRGFSTEYMKENGVVIYRMMFSEMKKTSLHDVVKFYPSVAMISKGNVVSTLRADSNEDVEMYNDYDAFKTWMNKYVATKK